MTRGVRWLCLAAVVAAILVAGCGSSSSTTSTSTTTTTTKAAKTTSTTTSGTFSLTPAQKAQALASCKNAAKAETAAFGAALGANFASEIDAICQKVANGDLKGAKAIAKAICTQVVGALPSGAPKATVEAACKRLG